MGQQFFSFGAAFLGSAVESTEALTIVLAVGLTRGWRAPLLGTVAARVALAVLVILFGQLIVTRIPDTALKILVGTLLLLFGLRWLHKAVLRSAGVVALHDEQRAYQNTVNQLQRATDWVGFILALKGVFLEGLEVVFIVIAVGGTGRGLARGREAGRPGSGPARPPSRGADDLVRTRRSASGAKTRVTQGPLG